MIYSKIIAGKKEGKKQLAVLIDPDKHSSNTFFPLIEEAQLAQVDYFFVGGSLMVSDRLDSCIQSIREISNIPVILFPGSPLQVSRLADAILFISLISGRNAEALIGQHVIAAPYIRRANLEVLPTGYMLVDAEKPTTVSYISNSFPIPNDKPEIAVCTAMAGEMLGLKLIYMDAGSGAARPVNGKMLSEVSRNISVPLIAGGGIRSGKEAFEAYMSGADILVVGNAVEKKPLLIKEIAGAAKNASDALRSPVKTI